MGQMYLCTAELAALISPGNGNVPQTKLFCTLPSLVSAEDLRQSGMETLEHVAVTVTINHPCRGNVEIILVCPSGMTSVIGARRVIDRYPDTHKVTYSTYTDTIHYMN